jgi:hypothetical protein
MVISNGAPKSCSFNSHTSVVFSGSSNLVVQIDRKAFYTYITIFIFKKINYHNFIIKKSFKIIRILDIL